MSSPSLCPERASESSDSVQDAYREEHPRRFIAREANPFLLLTGGLSALFFLLSWTIVGTVFALLFLFIGYFFRNPERVVPEGAGMILSPADGRVLSVTHALNPIVNTPARRVSIFMSIWNVHMNRFPIAGAVKQVVYRPGKFFVASLDKASEHNEQNLVLLEGEGGFTVLVVQIAGIVARRIVCYVRRGFKCEQGAFLGLIRFGSRVDLYLPKECEVIVSVGDRVRGGETMVGRMP